MNTPKNQTLNIIHRKWWEFWKFKVTISVEESIGAVSHKVTVSHDDQEAALKLVKDAFNDLCNE